MKVNWDDVSEAGERTLIPDGWYECQVIEVKPKTTQKGDSMFSMKFSVVRGDYKNKHFYDNVVFSKAGLPRAKLICKSMGINVAGEVELTPNSFRGKEVMCEVCKDGEYNAVTYAGYKPIEQLPF